MSALFPHQTEGAAWLRDRAAGALFDPPGLGKTATALQAAHEITDLTRGACVCVVCPAALRQNWKHEIARWTPTLGTIEILTGRHAFRWPTYGEVVILGYESLPEHKREAELDMTGVPRGCTLLVDEAHYAKSAQALRSKALKKLARKVLQREGRVWLLTGTPMPNEPTELWNVLELADLGTGAFGSWDRFRAMMGGIDHPYIKTKRGRPITLWTDARDPSVPDRLRGVSLQRRRDDVLDLPPKIREALPVEAEFPADVQQLLDAVLKILEAHGIDVTDANAIVDQTRLAKTEFDMISRARRALAVAKIPAVLAQAEVFEEMREPVVVFSAHVAPILALGTRKGWATLTGATPATDRQALIERFRAGELKGIGCTIGAGGVGFTLCGGKAEAHHELFVDLAWTPATNLQAEDRLYRIGQTRGLVVRRLVAPHALDERVEELTAKKQALIEATVDAAAVRPPRSAGVKPETLARLEQLAGGTGDDALGAALFLGALKSGAGLTDTQWTTVRQLVGAV